MRHIAVITGASSGIGREFARQLVHQERFDEIWAIARRAKALDGLAEEIGCPVRPISMDLSDPGSLEHYAMLLDSVQPNIKVLINCAGFGKFGSYERVPLADSLNMIDLNVKALVAMTELSLPYMADRGKVVEMGSMSAFLPLPRLNVYAAGKSFVLRYAQALARELRPREIRVLAVCPGWVQTPFFDRAEESSKNAVTRFKPVYQASDVVKTALHDLYHTKKTVSIHGAQVRLQVALLKLAPQRFGMWVWERQQKMQEK